MFRAITGSVSTLIFLMILPQNHNTLCAQTAEVSIIHSQCFGGNKDEEARSMILTADSGYVFVGISQSTNGTCTANKGGDDLWVVRVSSANEVVWQMSLGGSASDWGRYIQADAKGHYVLCGHSFSSDQDVSINRGLEDAWLLKLNSSGTLIAQKTFGGSGTDIAYQVQPTPDGGYVFIGGTTSNDFDVSGNKGNADLWLVKLDSNLNLQFQKCLGGSDHEEGSSIQLTRDGGYIISGFSKSNDGDRDYSYGHYDAWIIRTDAYGNMLWQRSYGGSNEDGARDVRQTADGGFIFVGYTLSTDGIVGNLGGLGEEDLWIVRLDSIGNVVWQKVVGGSKEDYAFFIEESADNSGWIIAGYSKSGDGLPAINKGQTDMWVLQIDNAGNVLWSKTMGGNSRDRARCMKQTGTNTFLVCGPAKTNTGDINCSHGGVEAWVVQLCVPFDYYEDLDGDGFGNVNVSVASCYPPTGYVAVAGDCNDEQAHIHPAVDDHCNGIDDNCNGVVDDHAVEALVVPGGSVTFCQGSSLTLTANAGPYTYQWHKNQTPIAGATQMTYTTSASGNYSVTVANAFCTSTSSETIVSKISKPEATITPLGNLDICGTGSVLLQANEGIDLTYQWQKGSKPIAGATNVVYTATSTGNYKVRVTNAAGCSKTSASVKVTKSCHKDTRQPILFTVAPNPASKVVRVWVDLSMSEGASYTLALCNLLGQTVLTVPLMAGSSYIPLLLDVHHLPASAYVLGIYQDGTLLYRQHLQLQ